MMKKIFYLLIIAFIFNTILFSKNVDDKTISVTINPQYFFVKEIVKDRFNINILIPKNYSPETFEIRPSSLVKLSKSLIYFQIGVLPFEMNLVKKINDFNKNLNISNKKGNLELIFGEHKCNENSHHNHDLSYDTHVWLSLKNAKALALNVYEEIIKIDKTDEIFYKKNYDELIIKIEETENKIKDILKDLKHRKFMVFHPAFTYFAKDFNLEQIAIEIDGKEPTIKSLKKFIDIAKENNIKTIFIQEQFPKESAKIVAKELDAKIEVLDPLSEDYLNNLVSMAKKIKESIK
jgi:zinc transport system substrate-binding protein